jgi:hypothetical protein
MTGSAVFLTQIVGGAASDETDLVELSGSLSTATNGPRRRHHRSRSSSSQRAAAPATRPRRAASRAWDCSGPAAAAASTAVRAFVYALQAAVPNALESSIQSRNGLNR